MFSYKSRPNLLRDCHGGSSVASRNRFSPQNFVADMEGQDSSSRASGDPASEDDSDIEDDGSMDGSRINLDITGIVQNTVALELHYTRPNYVV